MEQPAPAPVPVPTPVVATPPISSEIEVVALSIWQAVGVRTLRTYLQTLTGLTAAFLVVPVSPVTPMSSAYVLGPFIGAFIIAAQYALLPAIAALLQNLVELLTNVDKTAPKFRA